MRIKVGSIVEVITEGHRWFRHEGTVVSMRGGIVWIKFQSDPYNEHSFTIEDLRLIRE